MAEKKKGNPKKIFIIGGVVVALIVVLVLILTNCLPKGKSTEETYDDVASYRLMETEYNDQSVQFVNKIQSNANTNYYTAELNSINKLVKTMETVSEYYDDYFAIAQGGMKNRHAGNIHGRLDSIKQLRNDMTAILKESQAIAATGNTYLQKAVVDFRTIFSKLAQEYKQLFHLSNEVYHDSLGQSLVVSPASKVTLNIIDDFMAVISSGFEELVKTDVAGSQQASYNFMPLKAKIDAFVKFVYANLGTADYIVATGINEYYVYVLKDYDKIEALPAKLGEANYQNVISTIVYSGSTLVCTYTAKEGANVDNSELLLLKSFLGG